MSKALQDKQLPVVLSLAEEELQALDGPKQDDLHMVMVPYPLQGHINPMMQFAKALIVMHGVKISFINTKHNHECIQKTRSFVSSSPCKSTMPSQLPGCTSHDAMRSVNRTYAQSEDKFHEKLEFLWVDNGLPDDFDYTDVVARFRDFHTGILNMKVPLKQLLERLNQKSPPISCVVFGSFCPWIHTISAELGIPSVFFWTQSTSVLSIYYHAPLLAANGFFPYKKHASSDCNAEHGMPPETSKLVSYVPGVPPLHPWNIPTLLHVEGTSDPVYVSLREQFSILQSCQGIIVNSFEELERDAYQAMREELPFSVSLVGPLIPSAFLEERDLNDTSVGASLFEENIECIDWLDRQRKKSVLYVSFGSLFHLSAEDLASIANGIKDSKQPFLWVIRLRSSVEDAAYILPKGFLDDTKEHGLIVSWAPQTQVLSHPSVGAFLSHCGWNSTLESVSMGVPMITCPLISDQHTNSTYVCEFWKMGITLNRHGDGSIDSLDVQRAVRTVLEEKEGEEMRKEGILLREAARRASGAQRSSCIHMEEFIQTMRSHKRGR